MTSLTLLCRSATTFGRGGAGIDRDAYAAFLDRFVQARLGIYVGSAGSGESHSMSRDELKLIYEMAVAAGGGRIQVNANPPEQHTPALALEHSLLAARAGVGVVNIYGPAGWHGFRPTDDELIAYHDAIFADFPHPAALAPNPIIGYTPNATLIARLCDRYRQVVAVNLAGLSDSYFIQLKDALRPDVEVYVPYVGSLETLALGATGLLGAEANIIPKTFRRYLDLVAAKDHAGASEVYAQLRRTSEYLRPWQRSTPKWIKMFFKAFKVPGGEGGLRSPYVMPGDAELRGFTEGLLQLGVPEITEQAKAAGIA